jgi:hypothetical protein
MDDGNQLARAMAKICEAEGIAAAQVQSIQIIDDEIIARIHRPGGRSRLVAYPVIILADRLESPAPKGLRQKIDLR